ncbi:MAG: tetraacyldisaccharide 4'-kinase [Deltaproteobacteria bacterium]
MPYREPTWWYEATPSPVARLLAPVSRVYGFVSARRIARAPAFVSDVPIICIGNFTTGGTGKTPLSLWIARCLQEHGLNPVFLTRGYGSAVRAPTRVDPGRHSAADVGDEALLLARVAPVMVSPDRVAGVRALAEAGVAADAVLMDDGLQNPSLAKDVTIAVVDGERQFGNGRIFPAGPLRAPLDLQLSKTDLIVVNGRREDRERLAATIGNRFGGSILVARQQPVGATAWLRGARVIAFAGIGNPARFRRLLECNGASIVSWRAFADHHVFTDEEAGALLQEAGRSGATLVTTEKDFVRLASSGTQGALKAAARQVQVSLVFDREGEAILTDHLLAVIGRRKRTASQPSG